MNLVTLRFPPASAQKLGLDISPNHLYRLSWIELAFRLTRTTGREEFSNVDAVQRSLTSVWYACAASEAVINRSDWQETTWKAGLAALTDESEQIEEQAASLFLRCYFLAVFSQPERFSDLNTRGVRAEHICGWATTLSQDEIIDFGRDVDCRNTGSANEGEQRTSVLAAGMSLFLQWTGIEPARRPDEAPVTEPKMLPIPDIEENFDEPADFNDSAFYPISP